MADLPAPGPASAPVPSDITYVPGFKREKAGNGSGWILAIAILQAVGGGFMYMMSASTSSPSDPAAIGVLIVMLALALIFFGLWIWGRKSPFPALLTALVVFVSFHLLDAVLDPATLVQGIIMKIVVLSGLGTALKKAYVAKRERELETTLP
jgi:hypothetical protein